MTTQDNQEHNLDDLDNDLDLNEPQFSDEEKAQMAKYDEENGESNEINEDPLSDDHLNDIHVDDEFEKKLTEQEPGAKTDKEKQENENIDSNNPPSDPPNHDESIHVDAGSSGNDGANAQIDEPVIENIPDFTEQFKELDEQRQEAEGNISDTLEKLKDLSEQYDEGSIMQGAYENQKRLLERELSKLEKESEKLDNKKENLENEYNQKVQDYDSKRLESWNKTLIEFMDDPANELIRTNPNITEKFGHILNVMGQSGVFEGLSDKQILMSVRNQLAFTVPDLNKATPYSNKKEDPAQKKPEKPVHTGKDIPKTLAQMQSMETVDHTDPFAYIRKLSGIEYEEAIGKLSEDQLNEYHLSF